MFQTLWQPIHYLIESFGKLSDVSISNLTLQIRKLGLEKLGAFSQLMEQVNSETRVPTKV